jgi:hypothetical protein
MKETQMQNYTTKILGIALQSRYITQDRYFSYLIAITYATSFLSSEYTAAGIRLG